MSLGKCIDCGHQMSSSAEFCPNCGCTNQPLKKKERYKKCDDCNGLGYFRYADLPCTCNLFICRCNRGMKVPCSNTRSDARECYSCKGSGQVIEHYYS